MNPIRYNLVTAGGVVLASVGGGMQGGRSVSLIVAGALIVALSLATLRMLVR